MDATISYNTASTSSFKFYCFERGCSYGTNRGSDIKRHVEMLHLKKRDHPCTKLKKDGTPCQHVCQTKSALKTHEYTHDGVKPYKCGQPGCEFACSDQSSLGRHKKAKHGIEPARPRRRSQKSNSSPSSQPLTRTPSNEVIDLTRDDTPLAAVSPPFDFNNYSTPIPMIFQGLDMSPLVENVLAAAPVVEYPGYMPAVNQYDVQQNLGIPAAVNMQQYAAAPPVDYSGLDGMDQVFFNLPNQSDEEIVENINIFMGYPQRWDGTFDASSVFDNL